MASNKRILSKGKGKNKGKKPVSSISSVNQQSSHDSEDDSSQYNNEKHSQWKMKFEATSKKQIINPFEKLFNYGEKINREKITKPIASDCLPFNFTFSKDFATCINRVDNNPCFTGIPRAICRNNVLKFYREYQQYLCSLFSKLNCRVSLTFDISRDVHHLDYVTINVIG